MAKRTTQVFVGNLGNYDDKAELKDLFKIYGPVRKVWLARSPPGFGFVEFAYAFDASEACLNLDGKTFFGRRIRVELSRYDLGKQDDPRMKTSERPERREDRHRVEKRDYDSNYGSDSGYTAENSARSQNAGRSSTSKASKKESSPFNHRYERSTYSPDIDGYDTKSAFSGSSVIVDECTEQGSRESSPGCIVDEYIAEPDSNESGRKRSFSHSPARSPCCCHKRLRRDADSDAEP